MVGNKQKSALLQALQAPTWPYLCSNVLRAQLIQRVVPVAAAAQLRVGVHAGRVAAGVAQPHILAQVPGGKGLAALQSIRCMAGVVC